MCAVLDRNVLVSAVLSCADTSARLLRSWLVRGFELVVCPAMLDEPTDDYLICLAEESRAALVSGDTDLTSLPGRIPVYSPAAFAALLDIPS